jgi:putative membrane protein
MNLHRFAEYLPHVNASLNGVATVLLIVGYSLIKKRREKAHKWVMLACFGVSVLFLASYLTHKAVSGTTTFPTDTPKITRYAYYAILASHVVLAATVPFLASTTIYLGLADRRGWHVRLARITFPIWFYVSITGVIVYLMLYHIYAPGRFEPIIQKHEPNPPTTAQPRVSRPGHLPAGGSLGVPEL